MTTAQVKRTRKAYKMTNNKRLKLRIGLADIKTVDIDGKPLKSYTTWRQMIYRCYNPKVVAKNPTMAGNVVCVDWLMFSNFKKWFDANYLDGLHLDKDILNPGCNEYNEKNCCFVPQELIAATSMPNTRSNNPIGVKPYPFNPKKFIAQAMVDGKNSHLGLFDTKHEAFMAYRKAKKDEIMYKGMDAFMCGLIDSSVLIALRRFPICKPVHL